MKTVLFALLALGLSTVSFAKDLAKLENDKYSMVSVIKEKKDQEVLLKFTVKIAEGIKYNWDGPWKLKSKTDGKKNKTLGTAEFKATKSYNLVVPSKSKSVEYRLTAFICSKDKKRCFREVHKDTVEI